eukprot:6132581-Pyramimonas_sp.AAC.1
MKLSLATYELVFDTGNRGRSNIYEATDIGCIWQPGMGKPLAFGKGPAPEQKMRDDDRFGLDAQKTASRELQKRDAQT